MHAQVQPYSYMETPLLRYIPMLTLQMQTQSSPTRLPEERGAEHDPPLSQPALKRSAGATKKCLGFRLSGL